VQDPKVGALIGIPGSIDQTYLLTSRVWREGMKKAKSLYQGLRF
jgi:hypothetical protein